jgi:formylmethanofuran:tetrahydromethanopterin formyltransferase
MGVPTVTITTTHFADTLKGVLKEQSVPELSLVVVEHPIAGHNLEGIRKKMDSVYPEVMKAATKWQPSVR